MAEGSGAQPQQSVPVGRFRTGPLEFPRPTGSPEPSDFRHAFDLAVIFATAAVG